MKKAVSIKNKKHISFFIIILIIISIFLNSISGVFNFSDFALAENSQASQENQTPDLITTDEIFLTQRSSYEILETIENPDIPDRTYNEYSINGQTSPLDYPKYNKYSSNNKNNDNLQGVLEESRKICNYNNTYYDTITDDKKLLLNGVEVGTFYKHDAAIDNYGGNVSDSEPRLKVKLQINPREYGNVITGLYAPAGELIKITIPENMVNKGITITVGAIHQRNHDYYYLIDQINTKNAGKYRMPQLYNQFPALTNTTTNVGNMLGGPIYISGGDEPFEVIVEGAVLYNHFIYGTTTKEQYEQTLTSTAPYFDFEAEFDYYGNLGIRSSLPLIYKDNNLTYDDLNKSGEFWSYAFSVTSAFPDSGKNTVKNILCDAYVSTGMAFAIRGSDLVIAPLSYGNYVFDYDTLINYGNWLIFHELHHLFQGTNTFWGANTWGEATNNSLNALVFSMVTDISGTRTETYRGGASSENWSWVTSGYYCLKELYRTRPETNASNNNSTMVATYSTLVHSFGADIYAKIANYSHSLNYSNENFYKAVCEVTGYNMEYFLNEEMMFGISEETLEKYRSLPLYVPVFNVYGSGQILNMYNQETKTYTPYCNRNRKTFCNSLRTNKKTRLECLFLYFK